MDIKITVNLSESTQECLSNFATVLTAGMIAMGGNRETFLKYLSDLASVESDKPVSAITPAPVKEEIANESPEITDDEILAVIAEYKRLVPAKSIRNIFEKYGCNCSTACPKDKRAAMIEDIKALAEHAD